MAFKMKGSPMQRNFGISPIKDEKVEEIKGGKEKKKGKEKVMTAQTQDMLKRQGLTDEEIQAFVIKENQADTTGDYANKVVARYEGLDYTQKELDTAARIKKRKQLKQGKDKKIK